MDPVSLTIAGALIIAGFVGGYMTGRAQGRSECSQLTTTNRELMQVRLAMRAQIEAARDAVSRLVNDPRTAPHDKMALEDHVQPLLIRRDPTGETRALDTAKFWRLGRSTKKER
jgi:uncharacterized membrane protein